MGLGGEISGEMQKARHDKAVEEPPRERQRRIGQNIKQAGDQKVRQALEVVELDSPDAVDRRVRLKLPRAGVGG